MRAASVRSRTFKSSSPAGRAVIRLPFFRATNTMNAGNVAAAALSAILGAAALPAAAANTPKPSPHPTVLHLHLPTVPLHTEVVVEVNKKGQVVRVKSAKPSKVQMFNLQTYGNALQMWIRHPDGTAEVGLYRITYDYDPKTQNITRRVAIISKGGSWANDEGAANVMVEMERKQAAAAAEGQRKLQEEYNQKLPSLNQIRGVATPKPTHAPTLPPR
jgi:hypothetical protein